MRQKARSAGTKPKSPSQQSSQISNKSVELFEDSFGVYIDELKKRHHIKRYTWKNQYNIEAQVISYGARITSLKIPNRKGVIEDVIIGFDDIGGYLYYDQLRVGAIVGRVTGKVENGTFTVDEKQHWLNLNEREHHANGGYVGLDKVVWTPSIEGNKVLMSCISRDNTEGYPGDLFVCASFELTNNNDFKIDIEARTTKPTILNLSNLLFFNLGAHGAGPDDLYRHIVGINANCYLPLNKEGLPSGEIVNVIYTKNDFQIPKLLKNEMGGYTIAKDGYDSYLCVNRGLSQDLCFVARAMHPPSGRVLEVYSNQYGMYFGTANGLGHGVLSLKLPEEQQSDEAPDDDITELITTLHNCVADTLIIDSKQNYADLRTLIHKLLKRKKVIPQGSSGSDVKSSGSIGSKGSDISLSSLQLRYLENIMKAASEQKNNKEYYQEIEDVVGKIINDAVARKNAEASPQEGKQTHRKNDKNTALNSYVRYRKLIRKYNNILPAYTNDNRVHGKNDTVYKRHGAMCFQTMNYPNAMYHKHFPSCELRPGSTYQHSIVYKFWLQSGDPNVWLKRNCSETRENPKTSQA